MDEDENIGWGSVCDFNDKRFADADKHPDYHYEKKYEIRIYDDHEISQCILEKRAGKKSLKSLYMCVDISNWELEGMMRTSLEMGTNYLEDALFAMGYKWEDSKILARGFD